ncbi:hypothetical protein F5984_18620 [Rudanella paleaurantiibacter]|uniref:LPXTG cell wall anchor domain-containing protein n=1 Tax=Rudanella paleaurantiibacter TaxID=2614655 RepID=A0A7J5TVR6_9BACT|nr:hypothetical protein [Rudanella paleaurantiibacter]KAB7728387.1 hypothetical protein F5984_18620 [Rudanella paleaurantiibacter]
MRKLLPFLLLLSSVAGMAQTKPKPIPNLSKSDQAEIRNMARKQIENLRALLNTITFSDVSEFERDAVIKNSFLPNANQIFLNDGVIVEDDINPENTGAGKPADVPIEKYLRNLDLFYTKTEGFSIDFTEVIPRNVQNGAVPYLQVYFVSTFKSQHNQIAKPYQPTRRVAEFRAERVGKGWSVMITRLAFAPSVTPPPQPPTPVTQPTTVSGPPPPNPRYQRQGWLLIAGGVVSLAGGYLIHSRLQTDYKTYTGKVDVLNAEYEQWRELSLQPTGSPLTPLSFTSFSGSNSYAVYGAGATGVGLLVTGIGKLLKAHKRQKQQANK